MLGKDGQWRKAALTASSDVGIFPGEGCAFPHGWQLAANGKVGYRCPPGAAQTCFHIGASGVIRQLKPCQKVIEMRMELGGG